MKRCCKNIDVTDRTLLSEAVWDCISSKLTRSDTIRLFVEYTGLPYKFIADIAENHRHMLGGAVEMVVDGIRQEIINQKYVVKPIRYKIKKDGCNGKLRRIGIQDIKQQLYDYIAVYGLKELFDKKLGYYQCGAAKNKGNEFGASAIYGWLRDKNNRWAWQADVRHYYENIDKNVLKETLRRDVDNEALLHLVFFLIDTFDSGLSIGSYLSQFLANYYLSKTFIYASQMSKERHRKDGSVAKVSLLTHVLFQMDDILFVGRSKKNVKIAVRNFESYLQHELHLELKDSAKYMDLQTDYIDILGRKISRKNLTIRSSTFLKARRAYKKASKYIRRGEKLPLDLAQECVSRYGPVKNTRSRRFERKYNVKRINDVAKKTVSKYAKRNTCIRVIL